MSVATLLFGTFRYDPVTGRLTWSDEVFDIFGFGVGEVRPTLDLMARHQHPDDRAAWTAEVARAVAGGEPVSIWHRIIDARLREHTLQTGIQPLVVDDRVVELRGIVTDLTNQLRLDRAQEVERAVSRSADSRAVIDQAKGMLMAIMDLDETQAFELLRWHSSYTNVKLRDIAAVLVERLANPAEVGIPPRQRLTAILGSLTGRGQQTPTAQWTGKWTTHPAPPREESGPLAPRIPVALLPRTLVQAISAAELSITIADCLVPDWPLVYVNTAFETLTGYPAAEILGRNCRFLQGESTDPAESAAIHQGLVDGKEIRTVLRNYRRDGTPFWNELHLSAVRDATGRLTHYIGYQSDVSERIEREQQLEHLAYHDAVSGLPNEAAVLDHLERTIRKADEDTEFTVVHLPSPAVVERLTAALPGGAFLAVLDDAFLAVLPGKLSPSELDELRKLSATLGHSTFPHDGTEPQALLTAARGGR